MAIGVVTTVVSQVTYMVLARHGTVLQGTLFHLDAGYRAAFLTAAALTAVGLLTALLIPRVLRPTEAATGPDGAAAATVTIPVASTGTSTAASRDLITYLPSPARGRQIG